MLWLLKLEGTGANVIISVGVVVPSPELAGYPPGILYVSGTLVLFEDALLECLEGSRVMRIIIFTYILIHVTFAPSNQSCHTTVYYTAYLGESATPRVNLQPTWLYTSEVSSRRSLNDNSSSYRKASDYGTEDNHSESSSVHSDYDGSNASDVLLADYDVNFSYQDGHHSDLFENLFRTLPVDANKYGPPETTFSGDSGPLLFPPCDHPSVIPALLPHADDGVFLPQELHDSTFEQRAQLLYLNWHVLHGVDAMLDIKKWLESLSKEDHLLLIHLYAAYWVTAPVVTLSFGRTKAHFGMP